MKKVNFDNNVVFELLAEKNDVRARSYKTGQWEISATVCMYYHGTNDNQPTWDVVVKTLRDGEWCVVSTLSYSKMSEAYEVFMQTTQMLSAVCDADIISDDCGDTEDVGYIQAWSK